MIRDNITQFGGDPTTSPLRVSPGGGGLHPGFDAICQRVVLHKAVALSGTMTEGMDQEDSEALGSGHPVRSRIAPTQADKCRRCRKDYYAISNQAMNEMAGADYIVDYAD
ncbi:MAG: hypothetical protein R2806_10750 [Saprospiraceae bacterium]